MRVSFARIDDDLSIAALDFPRSPAGLIFFITICFDLAVNADARASHIRTSLTYVDADK